MLTERPASGFTVTSTQQGELFFWSPYGEETAGFSEVAEAETTVPV